AEYTNNYNVASPTKEYIYAGGQLIATVAGNTKKYFHQDHLSTRVVTKSNGQVDRTFGHYPFGESWYETGTADKWKFTSYERDVESGLDYAIFRYHASRLGRFQSPDPIAGSIRNPQSLNRYAYVSNDPINFTDPLGLIRVCFRQCVHDYYISIPDVGLFDVERCETICFDFDGPVPPPNTLPPPPDELSNAALDVTPGSPRCTTCIARADADHRLDRIGCYSKYYGKKAANLAAKGLHVLWQFGIPGPVDQDWEPGQGLGLTDYDIDACFQRADSAYMSRLDFCHTQYCNIDKGPGLTSS
ncbi:MAG: RHS repeat-associated core domain-containing protein, partial [Candidatus Acidiferrales bacterium]